MYTCVFSPRIYTCVFSSRGLVYSILQENIHIHVHCAHVCILHMYMCILYTHRIYTPNIFWEMVHVYSIYRVFYIFHMYMYMCILYSICICSIYIMKSCPRICICVYRIHIYIFGDMIP